MTVDLRPLSRVQRFWTSMAWKGSSALGNPTWKYLFRCIDIRSISGEEELLTVSAKHGVIPRSMMNSYNVQAESS